MGIGLALCNKQCFLHDGECAVVEVLDEIGGGVTNSVSHFGEERRDARDGGV